MAETRTSGSGDEQPPINRAPPRAGGSGDKEPYKGRPLGRILIKLGKLNRNQVSEALEIQKKHQGLVGEILVGLGYVNAADVRAALALQNGSD